MNFQPALMRVLEAAGAIALVGLILAHPNGFSAMLKAIGQTYADTVKGLEALP
jgi:hypothetical protein